MAWPKHFPEGCPPASIPDVHGEAFRLLLGTKVTPREMTQTGEDTKHFSLWLKEESLADARNLFAVVHVNPETEEPK
jgi:hypothetical protein